MVFRWLGRLAVTRPWWVIAAWVVVGVAVVAASPQLAHFTSSNNTAFLPSTYQSVQAQDAADRWFPALSGASGIVVVDRGDGGALTPADEARVAALAAALEHVPGVTSSTTAPLLRSADGRVQLVQLTFRGQPGDPVPNAAVPLVRQRAATLLAGSGLRAGLTGNAAISVDSTSEFANAEKIIGVATVLLILALLGLVFRSVLIAVLPIVVIGFVHQMAQAVTADLADAFGFVVGPVLAPLLLVVLFGVGTDYIVFLLFRYRERLVAGDDPGEALVTAVARAGEVIASAAATVMAAFAALLVASLQELKTLAPGLIVGIALMLAAALTLVPAVVHLLGRRLFWPTPPRLRHGDRRTASEVLGDLVARRPALVLGGWTLVLVGLSLGTLAFTTTYNQLSELPASTPSAAAFDTIGAAFPAGTLGPTQVFVLPAHGAPPPGSLAALEKRMTATPGVAAVLGPELSASGDQAVFDVILTHDPYTTTAMATATGPLQRAVDGTVPGARVLIGGTSAQLADVRNALGRDMAHVFPLALVIVGVILGLLLRAVVAPLYLLLGVVLTFLATLGLTTLVFIDGLGFAGLDFTIPIVVYLFVMAIGTDYNILIAARLREGFDAGLPAREASRLAVVHGGPAVGSAALVLAGTFASLLLTGIQLLQEIGLAVALGVLLAANVLAVRIVPTIAALRGWHFWWPHRRHLSTAAHRDELLEADTTPVGP